MKVHVKAIMLLAPLLVMTALPPATLAHISGASIVTVHPESCYQGTFAEESGSSGRDAAMDCSECNDCCSGHVASAEPAPLMQIDFNLTRFATDGILISLTSLNRKVPEHPPKLHS